MAGSSEESIKQRRARARKQKVQAAIDKINSKKLLEKWNKEQKHGRKSAGDLIQMLDIADMRAHQIRDTRDYQARSGSINRQIRGLLDHMFVQYPVPPFLYDACIRQRTTPRGEYGGIYRLPGATRKRSDPFPKNRDVYREWFIAIAQGASFPKLVKELMTSREAAMFLSAPDHLLIHESVWWAKMRVAGIPHEIVRRLIERLFRDRLFDDKESRPVEIIRFVGRFHSEIDPRLLDEIIDCIIWKLEHEPDFRMRGRTGASMASLSRDWHADMRKARLAKQVSWPGLGLRDWHIESWDAVWSVTELRSNQDLYWEGRKQRNCVHSYVDDCTGGGTAIFSLRKFAKEPVGCSEKDQCTLDLGALHEQSRATIEVESDKTVVQVKSKANAPIDADQYAAMKQWTAERALEIAPNM